MELNRQRILDSIKESGALYKAYGENPKNRLLNTIKNLAITTALVVGFSASSSSLANESGDSTTKDISTQNSVIEPDNLANTLNSQFLFKSQIELAHENDENKFDHTSHSMEENIVKDKRPIKTIMLEAQKNNHDLKGDDIYIPEFNVTVNKYESAESIQLKLLEESNVNPSDDVRVRAKVMAFIISNEGLSSKTGLDAQNHFTVGYGYDVDEQIKSRINNKTNKEFAKKYVYKALAESGINVDELTRAYNGSNYKINVTPAEATYLSAKTMDRYLAYAKKAAGPKLWGVIGENDVKPADYSTTIWDESRMTENEKIHNSYFNMDDRMKAVYVYSTYNFGPKSFGNKVKQHMELGNYYTAIHSITSTWKDKNGEVHKNYRWMNNMAFAMSSDKTMMTFINKDSDKYIKTEISNALSAEAPEVSKLLKLKEGYNRNVQSLQKLDIKKLQGNQLSNKENEQYERIKKQSDKILVNINNILVDINEPEMEAYDPDKHLIDFGKNKRLAIVSDQIVEERNAFTLQKLEEFDNIFDKAGSNVLSEDSIEKIRSSELGLKMKKAFLESKESEFSYSEQLNKNKDLADAEKLVFQQKSKTFKI